MTVTEIERFNILLPGRGRMFFGIVEIALDGYVNGTGFVLTKDTFKVRNLIQVFMQPVDLAEIHLDWNPADGVVTAYTTGGVEVINDALDGLSVRVMYWGF